MFSEQFLSTETLSASTAAELETVRVRAFVFAQVRTTSKELVADLAFVRLNSGVRDDVGF